nr:hypothetical protein [Chromatium okenii]
MTDSRQTLAERAHAVDTIIRNGRHLQALLNDVLDFSKIRAKRIELEYLRTSLPELLAGTVDSRERKLRKTTRIWCAFHAAAAIAHLHRSYASTANHLQSAQ